MNSPALRTDARRPRLAFVGVGWIGRQRLEALLATDIAEPVMIVDADPTLAGRVAEQVGAPAGADLAAALALEPDGVVIATPSGLHETAALAALQAGCAVFCQKPLATHGAGAARIVEQAVAADRLLGVDLSYRHVAGMDTLRECLRARELGTVRAIDLTFHNAYAPAAAWSRDRALAGGGCLLDLGVHLLDLALWLQDFPRMAVTGARTFARSTAERTAPAIEDLAFAELRQENGAIVRLACSWHFHAGQGAVIGVDIQGTRGGARWRNVAGSFHDFEMHLLRGDAAERVAGGKDEWGARALAAWTQRLAVDPRFDVDARGFVASAALIDDIYVHARGLP